MIIQIDIIIVSRIRKILLHQKWIKHKINNFLIFVVGHSVIVGRKKSNYMTLAGYMNVTLILTKLRHKKWKILLKHDKNQDVLDSFKTGNLICFRYIELYISKYRKTWISFEK